MIALVDQYPPIHPPIEVVKSPSGLNCYRQDNGSLMPQSACLCNHTYNPDCPVNIHAFRALAELAENLRVAGFRPVRRIWDDKLQRFRVQ